MRAPRVVVIGAGIGGLVAALMLAARGLAVTVVERAGQPGGKMRTTEVGGTRIDAGPTVFTMRWVFEDMFAQAGASLADHLVLRPAAVAGTARLGPERAARSVRRHRSLSRRNRTTSRERPRRAAIAISARARNASTSTLERPFIRAQRPRLETLVAALRLARPRRPLAHQPVRRRCGARSTTTSAIRGCASCSAAMRPIAARRRSWRPRR